MPSEANARVMSSFLDYLKVEKGLAPLTISAYTTDIGQFATFLEKNKRQLINARREDVRNFIQELFGNSVDGRSVGRKLSALRHLYKHLLIDDKIKYDPTLNIDSPKQWRVLPKSLAHDEIATRWPLPRQGTVPDCQQPLPRATGRCLKCFTPARCASPKLWAQNSKT